MANVIITNTGQSKITNAILNNSSVKFKYFKVSATDYPLDPSLTDLSDAWLTKDITSWLIVDNNNLIISCVIEHDEATQQATTFGIFDEDNDLIFVGKPQYPFPPGNRQIFNFSIVYTNIGQISDFSLLPWNDNELYLLVTDISTQLSNEIVELNNKVTDCKVNIDNLQDQINNIATGRIFSQPYKQGTSNSISFTSAIETGTWKFDITFLTTGSGPYKVYFNSDEVINIEACCGNMTIATIPIIYEITSIPTNITISTDNCELVQYVGHKLL
jgi:hypothetical protein